MTSRNLFLKLQKEDMKRRIWTISLSMLAFFLLFTVVCALKVSDYVYQSKQLGYNSYVEGWIYNKIIEFMGPMNEFLILITIVGAVICGLSGFFYLHSRKKVDLFHSMAIRREKLFAIVYSNGLLIYIVPYLINLLLCFIILGVNHYMNMEVFLVAITAFGINILYYILMYTIAIIAVMLTGNIIVSFLGTGVFYFYGPFVIGVIYEYFSQFFKSYYTTSNIGDFIIALSPFGNYINLAEMVSLRDGSEAISTILLVIAVNIVLIFCAVFLYKKRPSEAAGKAMVFPVSKPIIKLALVIPMSLAGGILFMNISNGYHTAWLIFGLIFSLLISYGIVEIIYNFDIRKAFHGKVYILASAVVVGVIVCIFKFDLFGYDTYIPDKNNVKTMSVAISGIDEHLQYYEFIGKDENVQTMQRMSDLDYQLKHMELTSYESAYAISEIGIEYLLKDKDEEKKSAEELAMKMDVEGDECYYYRVKYTLDRGKEVYRQYMIPLNKTYDLLQDVYEDLDYKKGHYPIYQLNGSQIKKVSCYNQFEDKEFSLNTDEKNELMEIYRAELSKLSLDDIVDTQPIATLLLEIEYFNLVYHVYPFFDNTINFLNEHGFDATRLVITSDIREISVTNWNYEEDVEVKDNGAVHETVSKYPTNETINRGSDGTATYTDLSSIEEIYSSLVLADYCYDNYVLFDVDGSIEVKVIINLDDYGNYIENRYFFKAGEVPEFVKKDIGIMD